MYVVARGNAKKNEDHDVYGEIIYLEKYGVL